MLIAGLDEAGRGPVLGPLVIGCVVFREENLHLLEEWGIDDSKKISPKKRLQLATVIKKGSEKWDVLVVSAQMINDLHYNKRMTLNKIEEINFANLLNRLKHKPQDVYLDACDTLETRFGRSISKNLNFKPKKIISKHKGDQIFKIVGAASIIAKSTRDQIMKDYHEKYGDCGSGYPSDKYTRQFLVSYYDNHKKFPKITRTWWKTAEDIKQKYIVKKTQTKLPF